MASLHGGVRERGLRRCSRNMIAFPLRHQVMVHPCEGLSDAPRRPVHGRAKPAEQGHGRRGSLPVPAAAPRPFVDTWGNACPRVACPRASSSRSDRETVETGVVPASASLLAEGLPGELAGISVSPVPRAGVHGVPQAFPCRRLHSALVSFDSAPVSPVSPLPDITMPRGGSSRAGLVCRACRAGDLHPAGPSPHPAPVPARARVRRFPGGALRRRAFLGRLPGWRRQPQPLAGPRPRSPSPLHVDGVCPEPGALGLSTAAQSAPHLTRPHPRPPSCHHSASPSALCVAGIAANLKARSGLNVQVSSRSRGLAEVAGGGVEQTVPGGPQAAKPRQKAVFALARPRSSAKASMPEPTPGKVQVAGPWQAGSGARRSASCCMRSGNPRGPSRGDGV